MNIEAKVSWQNDLQFTAHVDGFQFLIDSAGPGQDLHGPRPKGLTLVSLAGCTGMDVISILKKMKKEVANFEVRTVARVAEDHPRKILAIHITYVIAGRGLDLESVKKAVELSQGKYCGVSATLGPAVAITYGIELNGKVHEA